MSQPLSDPFENALRSGVLNPAFCLVLQDRDLIAELRPQRVDVYCKGNILFQLSEPRVGCYIVTPNPAFFLIGWKSQEATPDVVSSFLTAIPAAKQTIAEHKSSGKEIEFEQAMIRAANFESLNADYLIVDRQFAIPGAGSVGLAVKDRIDLTGIFWPDHKEKSAFPSLIEVKYSQGGNVAKVAVQISRYYKYLNENFSGFKENQGALLRQKARLGLFPGLSAGAQKKLKGPNFKINGDISDLRIVIALVDYSPRAAQGYIDALLGLDFRAQINVFHLGFAMWGSKSIPLLPKAGNI